MRRRMMLVAITATALMIPTAATTASPAGPRTTPQSNCGPTVSTTAKAHHRAQRGWDSKELITRQGAIDQVRHQANCVPEGKPERFVRGQITKARKQLHKAIKKAAEPAFPTPESVGVATSTLDSIRACESESGVDDASGTYHGYFQFDLGTWASVAGSADPHLASMEEQYYRAALLMSRSGSSPWPVCG